MDEKILIDLREAGRAGAEAGTRMRQALLILTPQSLVDMCLAGELDRQMTRFVRAMMYRRDEDWAQGYIDRLRERVKPVAFHMSRDSGKGKYQGPFVRWENPEADIREVALITLVDYSGQRDLDRFQHCPSCDKWHLEDGPFCSDECQSEADDLKARGVRVLGAG